MTFITPIENLVFFVRIQCEKLRFRSNFLISAKGHFCELYFKTSITLKFRGGNDFYNTNHSKNYEIRQNTTKSD